MATSLKFILLIQSLCHTLTDLYEFSYNYNRKTYKFALSRCIAGPMRSVFDLCDVVESSISIRCVTFYF